MGRFLKRNMEGEKKKSCEDKKFMDLAASSTVFKKLTYLETKI